MAETSGRSDWPLIRRLFLVSTAVTGGVLSFYSFVLTPVVFARIENPGRGIFLAAVFPAYFLTAAVLTAFMAACAWLWKPSRWILLLCAIAVGLALVNQFISGPLLAALGAQIRAEAITDPEHPLKREFGRWHGISQGGNLAVILSVWGSLALGLTDRRNDQIPTP